MFQIRLHCLFYFVIGITLKNFHSRNVNIEEHGLVRNLKIGVKKEELDGGSTVKPFTATIDNDNTEDLNDDEGTGSGMDSNDEEDEGSGSGFDTDSPYPEDLVKELSDYEIAPQRQDVDESEEDDEKDSNQNSNNNKYSSSGGGNSQNDTEKNSSQKGSQSPWTLNCPSPCAQECSPACTPQCCMENFAMAPPVPLTPQSMSLCPDSCSSSNCGSHCPTFCCMSSMDMNNCPLACAEYDNAQCLSSCNPQCCGSFQAPLPPPFVTVSYNVPGDISAMMQEAANAMCPSECMKTNTCLSNSLCPPSCCKK